jgi:hypothetical protein
MTAGCAAALSIEEERRAHREFEVSSLSVARFGCRSPRYPSGDAKDDIARTFSSMSNGR